MVIVKEEKTALVIQVSPSFWPYFFAQPLVVQFVGPAICFCLAVGHKPRKGDKTTRGVRRSVPPDTQFIVVYPERGEQFVPDQALFDAFPPGEAGKPIRPRELMIPLSEMRNLTGVRLFELERGSRRIFCAVPTWENEDQINRADSALIFIVLADLEPGVEFPENELMSPRYVILHGAYNARRTGMAIVTLVKNPDAEVGPPEEREKDHAEKSPVALKKQWVH